MIHVFRRRQFRLKRPGDGDKLFENSTPNVDVSRVEPAARYVRCAGAAIFVDVRVEVYVRLDVGNPVTR